MAEATGAGGDAEATDDRVTATVTVIAPPELEQGAYCNIVSVRATDYEFIIDFGQVLPRQTKEEGEQLRQSGKLTVPAKTRVVFPVFLIPRLVEILQAAFRQFTEQRGLNVPAAEGTKHAE